MGRAARSGLRAIFAVQLGIAAILLGADFARVAPTIAWPGLTRAPALDQPVRPGDQTRRFEPGRLSPAPAPGLPAQPDMPSRLFFEAVPEVPGTWRVTGTIRPGDAERFADWLAAREPVPEALRLHSPGGSVADALEIGGAIRAAGLDTEIVAGGICLSACPYILMGGVGRRISVEAAVGVHQHHYGESPVLPAFLAVEDIQRSQGDVLAHRIAMGIDPALMRHSLATPPDEIYLLVPEELERYRLATDLR